MTQSETVQCELKRSGHSKEHTEKEIFCNIGVASKTTSCFFLYHRFSVLFYNHYSIVWTYITQKWAKLLWLLKGATCMQNTLKCVGREHLIRITYLTSTKLETSFNQIL